ncbi:hypothetical protein BPNPMPFG_002493 [Mesorhizobium sp. AR07]|uniref:hypothetical protein n=1 Tax=Mesorhizobium sp. AR07 TaxID=2865838 RepID=UPI00215DF144|nr:hypothetical protein [Mesorhizobium sp. AR07]UVK46784.1 hypothetical protein BPNPMPFG_002493 [Mesorhizobium sp. AR07]
MDAEAGVYCSMSPDELVAIDGLRAIQKLVHQTETDAGWNTDLKTGLPIKRNFGELISLVHSELSEALEAHRKCKLRDDKLPWHDAVTVELADAVIRILNIASSRGTDLAAAILDKDKFNRERADHKLENRVLDGGKKY